MVLRSGCGRMSVRDGVSETVLEIPRPPPVSVVRFWQTRGLITGVIYAL